MYYYILPISLNITQKCTIVCEKSFLLFGHQYRLYRTTQYPISVGRVLTEAQLVHFLHTQYRSQRPWVVCTVLVIGIFLNSNFGKALQNSKFNAQEKKNSRELFVGRRELETFELHRFIDSMSTLLWFLTCSYGNVKN